MHDVVLSLVPLIITVGLLTFISLKYMDRWTSEERGFSKMFLSWKTTLIAAGVFAVISDVLALALGASWWQAGIATWIGWFVPFVFVTDFSTYKIPLEPSKIGYLAPLLIAIPLTWGNKVEYISFGAWFICPIVLLFILGLIRGGGFGMADIRILLLAATGLSWWVGYDWMLITIGLSAVIQLLISLFMKVSGKYRVKAAGFEEVATAKEDAKEDGKKHRMVTPYGPALIISFWVLTFVAIAADRTACSFGGGAFCL